MESVSLQDGSYFIRGREKRYTDPQLPVGYVVSGKTIQERILAKFTPIMTFQHNEECFQKEQAFEIIKESDFAKSWFVVVAFPDVQFIELFTKDRVVISTGLRAETFEYHDGQDGEYIIYI